MRTIEQLKSDLQISKNSSAAEISRIQEDLIVTREELDATQGQLAEYKRLNAELKADIAGLNDDLIRYRNLQDESTNDVSGGHWVQ